MTTDPLTFISLDSAKTAIGLPGTGDEHDAILTTYIAAAIGFISEVTGTALLEQPGSQTTTPATRDQAIYVSHRATAIKDVMYRDAAEPFDPWVAVAAENIMPDMVKGSWIRNDDWGASEVVISYTEFTPVERIPQAVIAVAHLLIRDMYELQGELREDNWAVNRLLAPYHDTSTGYTPKPLPWQGPGVVDTTGDKGPPGDKGKTGDKGPIGDKGPPGDPVQNERIPTANPPNDRVWSTDDVGNPGWHAIVATMLSNRIIDDTKLTEDVQDRTRRAPSIPPTGSLGHNKAWATDETGSPGWRAFTSEVPSTDPQIHPYLFYARESLSYADSAESYTVVKDGPGRKFSLLTDEAVAGRVYEDVDFVTEWFGGMNATYDRAGEAVYEMHIGHEFNGKAFDVVRTIRRAVAANRSDYLPLSAFSSVSQVSVGTYTSQQGESIAITEADLEGPTTITIELVVKFEKNGASVAANMSDLVWNKPQVRWFQVYTGAATTIPNDIRPHISLFDLLSKDGDDQDGDFNGTLPPGDIAGDYEYRLAIANSAHATSVRIIGFEGSHRVVNNPDVLATLTMEQFHSSEGTITVPSHVLAAAEVYTVRAEAHTAAGLASYHDDLLVADANADVTTVYYGYVPYVLGRTVAENAAAWSTAQSFATTSGIGDIVTISDVPTDTTHYLILAAVPAGETQPAEIRLGGFPTTASFHSGEDVTLPSGSVYTLYIVRDGQRDTPAGWNGETIQLIAGDA